MPHRRQKTMHVSAGVLHIARKATKDETMVVSR
jgi:hypothetical protein